MKVLLVQAKNKYDDRFVIHPPYGLLYLGKALQRYAQVESVAIYDMNIRDTDKISYEEQFQEVAAAECDVVGVSGMISAYTCAKGLAAYLSEHRPDVPMVVGGLLASTDPDFLMRNTCFDCAVVGEGEEVAFDVFEALLKKSRDRLDRIQGIYYRQDNKVVCTGSLKKGRRRRDSSDLFEDVSIPAYDLVDIKNVYLPLHDYSTDWLRDYCARTGGYYDEDTMQYAMPLFFGRGCPYRCTFCYSILDSKPIKCSIDKAFEHLEYLERNFGVRNFQIMDENFNIFKKWSIEFCKEAIRRGNPYYFTTGNRNRANLMDDELLSWMHKANFYEISVGVESLDDTILIEMNKGNDSATVMRVLKQIDGYGIQQNHTRCLVGFPSDTWGTMLRSIRRGRKVGQTVLHTYVIPFPGTDIYEECLAQGLITDEEAYWEELHWEEGRRNMTRAFSRLEDLVFAVNITNHFSNTWDMIIQRSFLQPGVLKRNVILWGYYLLPKSLRPSNLRRVAGKLFSQT